MRVFVTGATGFIGTPVTKALIAAGHEVLGLTRSDEGAAALTAAGATPHRGVLADLESLRQGAAAADGVIHLAFDHDFSKWVEHSEADGRAIEALGSALAGSDRPLIITSGTAIAYTAGRPSTEDDEPNTPLPRIVSEHAAARLAAAGIRIGVMRLPQVHDPLKQGLITPLIAIAREKGVSAYIGDGQNRWPAAHVSDVATLYRLALENCVTGARYNAVAEEGVKLRDIAESVARGLKIPAVSLSPEQAEAHFGWLAALIGHDIPASGASTQKRLGWHPAGPGLISDLDQGLF